MTNPQGSAGPGRHPHHGAPGGPPQGPPPQWRSAPPTAQPAPPPSPEQSQPSKGVLSSLFDTSFDHLVTPRLIRLWYVLGMLLVSLQCLVFLGLGLWIASWDDFWAWGLIMVVASPLVWLFEVLLVRIVMEAVVVRFKGVEYLKVIKDKP
jgi:uncharacterized protein DUF4282